MRARIVREVDGQMNNGVVINPMLRAMAEAKTAAEAAAVGNDKPTRRPRRKKQ